MATEVICNDCGKAAHLCRECGSMMARHVVARAIALRCLNCGWQTAAPGLCERQDPPAADRGGERCPRCDRAECSFYRWNHGYREGYGVPPQSYTYEASNRECLGNRPDWRARSLVAEASNADLSRRLGEAEDKLVGAKVAVEQAEAKADELRAKNKQASKWLEERAAEVDSLTARLAKAETPKRCSHLDNTPDGTRLAYLTGNTVRVLGYPAEDSDHNCDDMGCGTFSHVLEIYEAKLLDGEG